MPRAVLAPRLFNGEAFLDEHALLIEDGHVAAVVRWGEVPHGIQVERLPRGAILAPGFIDVQVNGGGGILLNDDPTVAGIRRIAEAHRRSGTTALLPTLISDTRAVMRKALAAAPEAIASNVPGAVGLHLEGPFLNVERKGVHRADLILEMTEEDLALLAEPFPGRLLVTLAPERVRPELLEGLIKAGVIVSIGHSAATYQEATEAIGRGVRGFTHLFNAMSQLGSREPGVVGAALEGGDTFAGIIADGHHVHRAGLRAAFRAKGQDRLMLVTDAMASLGTDLSEFDLQGRRILVAAGRLTDENGTLAGAHLDMASAVRNAVEMIGASLDAALRMASTTPADFLGLAVTHGKLAPGYRADAVALAPSLDVLATWIGGERSQ